MMVHSEEGESPGEKASQINESIGRIIKSKIQQKLMENIKMAAE